jgi:hypothetical protein
MIDDDEAEVPNRDAVWYAHLAARLCQAAYYVALFGCVVA